MVDEYHQHQDVHVVSDQEKGLDLQQRGQEAVQNLKQFLQEKGLASSTLVAFVTVIPLGFFLLGLSGLSFIGSFIALVLTTPLFILFSPVLVPAVLAIGLAILGFLASATFGITAVAAFSWIYNYYRGFRPGEMGLDMEHVARWAYEKAGDVGHIVKKMGHNVTDRVREE